MNETNLVEVVEMVDLYPVVEVVSDAEADVLAYEAQRAVDLGWARLPEQADVVEVTDEPIEIRMLRLGMTDGYFGG